MQLLPRNLIARWQRAPFSHLLRRWFLPIGLILTGLLVFGQFSRPPIRLYYAGPTTPFMDMTSVVPEGSGHEGRITLESDRIGLYSQGMGVFEVLIPTDAQTINRLGLTTIAASVYKTTAKHQPHFAASNFELTSTTAMYAEVPVDDGAQVTYMAALLVQPIVTVRLPIAVSWAPYDGLVEMATTPVPQPASAPGSASPPQPSSGPQSATLHLDPRPIAFVGDKVIDQKRDWAIDIVSQVGAVDSSQIVLHSLSTALLRSGGTAPLSPSRHDIGEMLVLGENATVNLSLTAMSVHITNPGDGVQLRLGDDKSILVGADDWIDVGSSSGIQVRMNSQDRQIILESAGINDLRVTTGPERKEISKLPTLWESNPVPFAILIAILTIVWGIPVTNWLRTSGAAKRISGPTPLKVLEPPTTGAIEMDSAEVPSIYAATGLKTESSEPSPAQPARGSELTRKTTGTRSRKKADPDETRRES